MEISEALLRISIAFLIGGLFGLEREYRDKGAGLRTMMLIGTGSALFTVLSIQFAADSTGDIDPTRIMSSIIGGIGFLGGGVILKNGLTLKGLTTASTIWLVAALGIGSGMGYHLISLFTALIALFALIVLPYFEHKVDNLTDRRDYVIHLKDYENMDKIASLFTEYKIKSFSEKREKQEKLFVLSISANGSPNNHIALEKQLIQDNRIQSFIA